MDVLWTGCEIYEQTCCVQNGDELWRGKYLNMVKEWGGRSLEPLFLHYDIINFIVFITQFAVSSTSY